MNFGIFEGFISYNSELIFPIPHWLYIWKNVFFSSYVCMLHIHMASERTTHLVSVLSLTTVPICTYVWKYYNFYTLILWLFVFPLFRQEDH